MTDELLAAYIRQLIEAHRVPEVPIARQGDGACGRLIQTPSGREVGSTAPGAAAQEAWRYGQARYHEMESEES